MPFFFSNIDETKARALSDGGVAKTTMEENLQIEAALIALLQEHFGNDYAKFKLKIGYTASVEDTASRIGGTTFPGGSDDVNS